MKITYTHRGWFGLVPVYYGNLEAEAPYIDARWADLRFLIGVMELLFRIGFAVVQTFNPNYRPFWPLLVTGELYPAIERDHSPSTSW